MSRINLSRAMDCFHLTESQLAAALHVDRAQINRWKNGTRALHWNSAYAKALAEYLLSIPYDAGQRALRDMLADETNWQPDCGDQVVELAAWLCRPIQVDTQPAIARALHESIDLRASVASYPNRDIRMPKDAAGYLPLEQVLRHIIYVLRENPDRELLVYVDISDIELLLDGAFSEFWQHFMGELPIHAKVLISQRGRQGNWDALLAGWVPLLSKGRIELLSAPEPLPIRYSCFQIDGEEWVFCLVQPSQRLAPSFLCLRGEQDCNQLREPIQRAISGAQPLISMLHDRDLARVETIFYEEFALPGGYDILKSGINTMLLDPADFRAFLLRIGLTTADAEFRTGRFTLFQQAMCDRLERDPARELLSIAAIHEMVQRGGCMMPGVYFDIEGLLWFDREGVEALFRGYASFLRKYENLTIKLSGNTPQFLDKLCWHIKPGNHVMLQTWAGETATSVYVENPQLINEFSRCFAQAWEAEPTHDRADLISQFELWGGIG